MSISKTASNRLILFALSILLLALLAPAACSKNSSQPIVSLSACGSSDGICPSGCTFYEDSDCAKCSSTVGLTVPIRPCSPQYKCVNLLGAYPAQGIIEITAPTDVPTCATRRTDPPTLLATGCYYGGRGNYTDSRYSWIDADSTSRYWCEYRPAGTLSTSKRPVLIFVHGSGGGADDIYDNTKLRTKAIDYNLSGDAGRLGFILVSVQGRNLHWPTADPEEGSKHDSYHRNPATNRDVAFFDHLIDSLVAEGVADSNRIYLTGWSNGARFAAFYGITRHESTTPGGNKVAAIAPYSGGDPFENIASNHAPSCKQDPYPTTTLPFLLISRNCDGIACNQEQFDAFNLIWTMTPGNQAEAWISTLTTGMGDISASWLKIGYSGADAPLCLSTTVAPVCTTNMALRNHFCWPDGVSDGGGNDREPNMLEFLKANPLP